MWWAGCLLGRGVTCRLAGGTFMVEQIRKPISSYYRRLGVVLNRYLLLYQRQYLRSTPDATFSESKHPWMSSVVDDLKTHSQVGDPGSRSPPTALESSSNSESTLEYHEIKKSANARRLKVNRQYQFSQNRFTDRLVLCPW